MRNTEQIRHQPTTQRNEQADNTIGDLQAKMDKLILEMNSVIADFNKKITEIGTVVLNLRVQNDTLSNRLLRLEKTVNKESEEYVTKNLIEDKVYGFSWSALNQRTPTSQQNTLAENTQHNGQHTAPYFRS